MKNPPHVIHKLVIPIFLFALLCGLISVSVQQTYRQNANDPQIQYVEDAVAYILGGADPKELFPNVAVDPSVSLDPFMMQFNARGELIGTNMRIKGEIVTPPKGVLDYAREHGENRVTWETKDGTRIATVVKFYGGLREGYVLSGRSLREVEKRERSLTELCLSTWFAGIIGLLVIFYILHYIGQKRNPTT